jgi:hypothetical protein
MPDGETTDQSGLEAAPALPSRRRAKEAGLMTLVTSGLIGTNSSTSAALQLSLENRLMMRLDMAGSTLFKETWKRRRTPLGRSYLEHTARAARTSDNDSTSLASVPTPDASAMNLKDSNWQERQRRQAEKYGNNGFGLTLGQAVSLSAVPTPCTPNGGRSMSTEAMDATGKTVDGRKHTASLEHTVKFSAVATPQARDYFPGHSEEYIAVKKAEGHGMANLNDQVMLAAVATPTCPAPHDTDQTAGRARPRKGYGQDLAIQASLSAVSTPNARDYKHESRDPGAILRKDGSQQTRLEQLPRQVQLAASGQTATGGMAPTESIGQLDPAYSRWLMGAPPEWDDFVYMATQSLSRKPRSSSKRSKT